MLFLSCMAGNTYGRHFKDTVHFRKATIATHDIVMSDSALEELGVDSLLNKVEHIHNGLNDIINITGLGFNTRDIEENYAATDSNIDLIDQNLKLYNNILDVKNLQMFEVLLSGIHSQLTDWRELLFVYDRQLLAMSSELTSFRNDTLLKEIMEDSVFSNEYANELQDVKDKMKLAKRLIAENQARLKQWQVNVSNQYFETIDLENRIKDMLRKISVKAIGKEYNYLWEAENVSAVSKSESGQMVKQSYSGQQKILTYYFKKNWLDQFWMLLTGVFFFVWIFSNFKQLEKAGKYKSTVNEFIFINKVSILSTLVLLFSIAPFFDLHPPTAYVQVIEFLLVTAITFLLWNKWAKDLLYYWFAIAVLYIAFSVTGILLVPTYGFRVLLLCLNIVAVVFGILWFRRLRKNTIAFAPMIKVVTGIFVLLNIVAVFGNLYGRLSIAKIFSVTAIYGLAQIIGLSIFIQIILEAFHLQTIVNKLKGGLIGKLNFMKVEKLITTILVIISIVVWCIVFSISLNIYNLLYEQIVFFLTKPRKIGTTDFQIGNILLFLVTIYISNLFQQGVGSLYGRQESNWDPEIKKNASRLAITRLLLIVVGFFIAVAASGLPMDKITIVLGALGVGIGLGLQTIVNNLVSGVILIFEQPFRIGDYIELGDKRGRVIDIGIRSSKILMEEGAEIIMPNADLLSGRVINWTLRNDNVRIELAITIMPGHTVSEIEQIIREELKSNENVVTTIEPEILLSALTDKSMSLRILVWINDVHKTQMLKSKLLSNIYAALEKNEIKIV